MDQQPHALTKPIEVTIVRTFATAEAYIAGRTGADVKGELAAMDGSDLPSVDRRAILAAIEARKAAREAAKAA
jgi:hypothetical protein